MSCGYLDNQIIPHYTDKVASQPSSASRRSHRLEVDARRCPRDLVPPMNAVGDGISAMVSLAGVSVPARARFLGHFISATTYSSLTYGLAAGQVGAMTRVGPLLPFLAGSWAGYTVGCVGVWRRARAEALSTAERYPKLLEHVLREEFAVDAARDVPLEDWIAQTSGRMTYAILAAQACQAAVQELNDARAARLVEGYAEAEAE